MHVAYRLADRSLALGNGHRNERLQAYQVCIDKLCIARTFSTDGSIQLSDKYQEIEHLVQRLTARPSAIFILSLPSATRPFSNPTARLTTPFSEVGLAAAASSSKI